MTLSDFSHFDFRIVGTVTMFLPESFSSVHLKRNHFITLYLAQDFSLDHLLNAFSNRELTIRVG